WSANRRPAGAAGAALMSRKQLRKLLLAQRGQVGRSQNPGAIRLRRTMDDAHLARRQGDGAAVEADGQHGANGEKLAAVQRHPARRYVPDPRRPAGPIPDVLPFLPRRFQHTGITDGVPPLRPRHAWQFFGWVHGSILGAPRPHGPDMADSMI